MDLIVIIGSGAVGKMTVGQQLMKITDFRLFHNHMMIEPVLEIFGGFNGEAVTKLREVVFEEFMKTNYQGMIFTFMWAFDQQSDWDYIKSVADRFEATGGTVYYVELVADRAVRIERNKTENRLKNKASKRDLEASEARMLREETHYRVVSNEGEVPFENYIKIDNTNLEPDVVAKMIKDRFKLPGPGMTELMSRVKLEEVPISEIEQLYKLQVESFMPLYEKYHDDGSPAIEPLDKVKARAGIPTRKYYFILRDGARIGGINVGTKAAENDDSVYYISPIFIVPAHQNRGVGYAVIKKIFEMCPEAKTWKLDTIKEEAGNCHFYEKCGFVRTGEEHVINDKMTLVDYELKVEK
ncbi:MAG: GNAT family N-acetyltransferase [Lachnospiraceae bacterium]|nr:GNAT family N-acetyltransferase [Lachnospiraceae bacterium]